MITMAEPRDAVRTERGHVLPRPTPSLDSILFPSDLSPESDRAFVHADFLARKFGSRVTVFHATSVPHVDPVDLTGEIARRQMLAARTHLETRTPCDHLLVGTSPSPAEAVLDVMASLEPHLTVMATHGRDGLAKLVLGSVTETVLRTSRRPVLCVREPDHGVALPYRRLLVPVDLSDASRRALPLAGLLARAFHAEILLAYVMPVVTARLDGVPERAEAVPTEAQLLEFARPDLSGLRLAARVETGTPWHRIIDLSRYEKPDLVVMSRLGRHAPEHPHLGRTTERIVRQAPCPVLVV